VIGRVCDLYRGVERERERERKKIWELACIHGNAKVQVVVQIGKRRDGFSLNLAAEETR
jgi:hypothetical protein